MPLPLKITLSLISVLLLRTSCGQAQVKDTAFFSHITFFDQDKLPEGPNNHLLVWHTQRYIPYTHFVIEHFCWGRWVNRRTINESSKLGRREYFGKSSGECQYKFRIQPHSGENSMRVLLMNDSNACLAISKELKWISPLTEKVSYNIKKSTEEINFSSETDYEVIDSKGIRVKEGRGTSISYKDLDSDTYTLNYDNSSATFSKKK